MAKSTLKERLVNEVVISIWCFSFGAILTCIPILVIEAEPQKIMTFFKAGGTKNMPDSMLVCLVLSGIGVGMTIIFGCISACPSCKEAWIISNIYHFFTGVMLTAVIHTLIYLLSIVVQSNNSKNGLSAIFTGALSANLAINRLKETSESYSDEKETLEDIIEVDETVQFSTMRVMKTISNCSNLEVGSSYLIAYSLLVILAPFFLSRASICKHVFFQAIVAFIVIVVCSLLVPIRLLINLEGADTIECRYGVDCSSLGLITGLIIALWGFLIGLLTIFTTKKKPVNKVKMAEYLSW